MYSRFQRMIPTRPPKIRAGTALVIIGLGLAIMSSFLPWVITETTSIMLFQTDWWIALIPATLCSSCGFTRFGRRAKTIAFTLSGLLIIIGNIGVFTALFPNLESTFAVGFYASLGSASLMLEGGIVTYLEKFEGDIGVPQTQKPVIPRLCPGCANDISAFSRSLRICPMCNIPLEPPEKVQGLKPEELIVVGNI